MRIKISGTVLSSEGTSGDTHSMYSMILSTLKNETASVIHDQLSKIHRRFTFSYIYRKEEKFHFYLSGEDVVLHQFMEYIQRANIQRVGGLLLAIESIDILPILSMKSKYLMRGNIIATEAIGKKKKRLEKDEDIEERLTVIAKRKLEAMGVSTNISFELLRKDSAVTRYRKDIHLPSWKSLLLIKGDYEAIQTIYEIGAGENTATGHGLLWEV